MRIFFFIIYLLLSLVSKAQIFQYEINYSFTLPFALSQNSPKSETAVSPIRFKHPTSLKFSLNPKLLLDENNKIGIFTSYEDYEYGYDLSYVDKNGSAGLIIAGGRTYCGIFKIGFSYENILYKKKNFEVGSILFFNIGKEFNANEFNDTSIQNAFYRNKDFAPYRQAILLSSDINSNIVFLPSIQLYLAYKIGARFSINIGGTYQQGFKNIVTTYTSIEIPSENKSAIYKAKFNGTAILGSFGLSYRFGKKDY